MRFNPFPPEELNLSVTADALLCALNTKKEWRGKQFTVCNSDNLYSITALRLLLESNYPNAMIDYDRDALLFPPERVQHFAVMKKDDEGFLLSIIEKPSAQEVENARGKNGAIGREHEYFQVEL